MLFRSTGGNLLTGGIISASGNVTGSNIRTAGQITASGNVSGAYFIGNGSQLTGITVSAGSSIVNGTSNISIATNGNVTVGVAGTSGVTYWANTGQYVTGVVSVTGNITGGNFSTFGNITGGYFIGNGSQLTGISNYGNANVVANLSALGSNPVSTTGNITGGYFIGNGSQLTGLTTTTRLVSGDTELAIEIPSGNMQASIGGTANVVVFHPTEIGRAHV